MEYIEKGCTFKHEGQTFEAGGAMVTDSYAIGYFKQRVQSETEVITYDQITDWHGETLTTKAFVKSFWPIHSHMSSHMYQVHAKINDIWYSGRTLGNGMIWRGKRMAGQ